MEVRAVWNQFYRSRIGYALTGAVVALVVTFVVQVLIEDVSIGGLIGAPLGIGIANYWMGRPPTQ